MVVIARNEAIQDSHVAALLAMTGMAASHALKQ
jgi:hypothetical protein